MNLITHAAPEHLGEFSIDLGVLELEGGADRKRRSHDELQAPADGGKNPRS